MSSLLTDREARDDFGLTEHDWHELRAEQRVEDRRQRWAALCALWCAPIKQRARDSRKGWTIYDGYERNRDEEWTLWRSIVCSVALIFGRHWGQDQEDRYGCTFGTTVAYFDARDCYGGYEIMLVKVYPRCRMSIFSDGECTM